ncbi:MAG: Xaa-Pro aminopeptidase [Gammaproteobacteria bacterium]|nr:Xaa-Pro aminopeptidase [Gammaproteobacteria bacterium]
MSTTDIYQRRRQDLMHFLKDGIAVLTTAPHQSRNGDVFFQFRPDSDFYYLTHFPEPEAIAVIVPGRPEGEFLIFCREKDPFREQWDGYCIGLDAACEQYGANESFPIDEFENKLPELLDNRDKVYTMMGRYPDFDQDLLACINEVRNRKRAGMSAPGEFSDLRHILHEARAFKSKEEVRLMQKAAKISAAGHQRAMQTTRPGMFEYQVQAELECEFRRGGSEWPAYPSIVAGGKNGCVLHYVENNCVLNDGELLLIDAGAELDCYASDITRTFPINGRFSGEQKALYEVVLNAQKASIEKVHPDATLIEYHDAAVEALTEGLVDLGILQGEIGELIETNAYHPFYMHRTGHWLGMDVHDVGDYKIDDEWRILESGMVLTVEPGLYISPSDNVDEKWHNMAIRIEDDILVTRNGNENLSNSAPKEMDDIEHLMTSG